MVEKHLRLLAFDMAHAFQRGIRVKNQQEQWYLALVGIKGDMKIHAELFAKFTRCYSNLGRSNHIRMCAWCWAGDEDYPFEECSDAPNWVQTMFQDRPWPADVSPELSGIPFDASRPEYAPFHLMKVGLTRDVVGSLLVVLCRLGFWDYEEGESQDINVRLQRAHGSFRLYCSLIRKSPGLRSFTRAFVNSPDFSTSPWTNSKGSDSTLLVNWLTWFVSLHLCVGANDRGCRGFLQVARHVLQSISATHRLWLARPCAERLYLLLLSLCRGYCMLARRPREMGMVSFSMKPKYHGIKHVAQEVREQLLRGAHRIMNPNANGCEVNEDHVGRVASLSRKVSTRLLTRRVHDRTFLKTRALFRRRWKAVGSGSL